MHVIVLLKKFRSIALSGAYNTIDTYFKTNGDVLFTNLKKHFKILCGRFPFVQTVFST